MPEPAPELQEPVEPVADETPTPEDYATVEEALTEGKAQKPTDTVEFWKAKSREWEDRSKNNEKAAQRLADLEEEQKKANMTLQERAEAAEADAAALRAEKDISAWKTEIADMKKYEGVKASWLRGTTREELEAHAAEIKADLPEPRKPGSVPGEGRQVATGKGDPKQIFADIIRGVNQ